jgi:hypothetical protein
MFCAAVPGNNIGFRLSRTASAPARLRSRRMCREAFRAVHDEHGRGRRTHPMSRAAAGERDPYLTAAKPAPISQKNTRAGAGPAHSAAQITAPAHKEEGCRQFGREIQKLHRGPWPAIYDPNRRFRLIRAPNCQHYSMLVTSTPENKGASPYLPRMHASGSASYSSNHRITTKTVM